MQIDYTCRNAHLDNRLREAIEQKLEKVARFLEEPVEVKVVLDIEKHRHLAEVHITHRLGLVQAQEENDSSLDDAVHLALERAEKQARRSHQKLVDKRRRPVRSERGEHANGGHRWPIEILAGGSVGAGETPRVIETTYLPIKPMTIEEAAMQLESAEHGFVVFRDSQSDRLNVLFKRKDQNYGLIAPEP
jgi:putative sigma-54 modulation protein